MPSIPKPEHISSAAYIRWLRNVIRQCELCGYEQRKPCSAKLEVHHIQARGRHGDDRVSNLIVLGGTFRGCHALVGREGISTERLKAALAARLARWQTNGMMAQAIEQFLGIGI